MGRMKKKAAVPLSLFYLKYFAYIFVSMLFLVILLLVAFNALMNSDIVYPANYAQEQAAEAYDTLQQANEITPDLIPDLCDYTIFDLNGNAEGGNLPESGMQDAWAAVQDNKMQDGGYYFTVIPRDAEYCVLRYRLVPQYKSPFLHRLPVLPQSLIFVIAVLGILFIIVIIAIFFGKALNKRLSVLVAAANKIERQELDFEISNSGIKEIDTVLSSMDSMRIALKESLEQQWKIEQRKNRQMSALAHDLKTPLTIVRGNAELLLESDLSEVQKKYTEYIENSSLQMQNYVQTLIEVTKSWQGYQFRPEKYDCSALFKEIEQQAKSLCTINGLILRWDCKYITNQVFVDHDLFVRAVINVISNAAEHSPKGGTVTISVAEENNFFVLCIYDTGAGFSEEALKRGTEQFYMDDISRNSKTHFGIGLYAADSIIQKHNGKLILENSEETGGAKVTIKLPC